MLSVVQADTRVSLFGLCLTEGTSQRMIRSPAALHDVLTRVFRPSANVESVVANRANVRESCFQVESNASWANFG